MNSPILTCYGDWTFRGPISIEEVKSLMKNDWVSAIGHQSTAIFMSQVIGIKIPFNRIKANMQLGDQAVILRLLDRLPEGVTLTFEEMENTIFEFGLLTKIR